MQLQGRTFSSGNYRYGFNGKENDNEVKGEGNQQDYGFRIYDPRLGKFLSVDPLTSSYPWYTPYQFAGNKPINSIDLDGLEEYESYDDYKKAKGDKALKKMDGSDGAWLESDRESKNNVWLAAMAAITKNGWADKLRDNPGDKPEANETTLQQETGTAFGVVRDYYLWAQSEVDSRGFHSKWAQGAAYLCDELAETYEEGNTSGAFFKDMARLLKDLNFNIATYAVTRYKGILYDGEKVGTSYLAWYHWDAGFVDYEQGPVAQKVYSQYVGTDPLDQLNDLSRKNGFLFWAGSKLGHFFPDFSTFDELNGSDANINVPNSFGLYYRINIPLFMLWPSTHGTVSGIKLNNSQIKEINKANDGINSFYNKNKLNKK